MENFIIIAVIVIIVGTIVFYLVRAKKNGVKCVGCPYAKQCGNHCNGNCNGDSKQIKKL